MTTNRRHQRTRAEVARRQRIAREALHGGIPSPCIAVCRLDERTNVCIGCYRLDSEISGWVNMSDAERQAVLAKAEARRVAMQGGGAG